MYTPLFYDFVLVLTGLIILLAGVSDALRFRIPNIACLGIIALFPFYVALAPITVHWLEHLGVFAAILVTGYFLFVKKLAGAGDIKLLASIGLWAGPTYALHFLFMTALTGGILSLGIGIATVVKRKLSPPTAAVSLAQTPVPYGIAIAVGGLSTLILLSHPDLLSSV